MRKYVFLFFFSITGSLFNIGFTIVLTHYIGLPLFLDTIFTIAVTLTGGLAWGILCGAFTNIINSMIWFQGWGGWLFAFCSIATAFVTWLFMRLFPREINLTTAVRKSHYDLYENSNISKWLDKMIVLILLSFALCITMSVLGGFIAALILSLPSSHSPEALVSKGFSDTMFNHGFPVFLQETLTRIPINIIDRLISVFAGYCIALGSTALLKLILHKK
ncbi:MAG: hypothetical protein FWC22_03295 [Treponema sp.]|nr:hypothetical protein [Treponema sp.]